MKFTKGFNWLIVLFSITLFSSNGIGQCFNTNPYLTATAPAAGTTQISTCTFQTEYNTINGVAAATNYTSDYSLGGCITVTQGTPNGPVVGTGPAPLNWTSTVAGTYYVHYTTSCAPACGQASSCGTSTITYGGGGGGGGGCCTINIDMFDTFGDGWNGGFLEVFINGVSQGTFAATGTGSSGSFIYCDGDQLDINYTGGAFETENSYTITSPAGTLISAGPSPTQGNVFGSTTACSSTANTGGGGAGCSTCATADVIPSLPFISAGNTTCGACDNYSSTSSCASSYMNGDDYIFEYTPSTTEFVDITISNSGTWAGLFVTQGCPDAGAPCTGMNTNSAGNPEILNLQLNAGVTYYITVSTWPSPQCIPFDITVTVPSCNDGIQNQDETGIDCGGTICGPCPDCNDGIQNGDETGVDCGGTWCVPCSCFNGVQDPGEDGVDCGNICGTPCPCGIQIAVTPNDTLPCPGGAVTLVADGQGSTQTVLGENFNGGANPGWQNTGGATYGNPCGPGADGSTYYWASTTTGGAIPNLTTIPFDMSCGGQICFDMAYATQGGAAPCEGPDLANEGVYLQYSTDGGATWTQINYWDPVGGYDPTLTSWNNYCFTIPAGAWSPNTIFQWTQTTTSGSCCDNWGVDNVDISAIACSGYNYDWDHVPGYVNDSNQVVNVNTTTTFGVWYSNGIDDSCYQDITIVVDELTNPIIVEGDVSCNGFSDGSINISGVTGGQGIYTYDIAGPVNQTNGTGNFTGLPAGTYNITVTDAGGCTITATATITEPPGMNVTLNPTDESCDGACDGQAAITNVTGGTAPYSYNWSSGGAGTSVNGLCDGNYSVIITDAQGCTQTENYTINPGVVVTANFTYNGNQCLAGNSFNFTNTSTNSTSWNWNFGGGTPATSTAQNPTGVTYGSAGTYTVTLTANNGACSDQTTINVVVYPDPTVAPTGTDISCNGVCDGTVAANAAAGTPGYSYAWTNGAGTGATANGLCAGTYDVTVTDLNACTATGSVTITEPPLLTVNATGTNVSCNGVCDGSLDATTAGGTPPYTFSWSGGPSTATEDQTNVCAGTYTLTVTDASGCTATASYTVTEPTPLTLTATGTNVSCNGACDGTLDATTGGGTAPYTYAWSGGPSTTTEDQTNVCAGTYNLTVTDANGCTATASYTVTEPTVLTVTATGTNASCNGVCDGTVSANATGGAAPLTYSWSNGAGTNATASGLCANTYTITVTDANGCIATDSYTVTEPTALTINLTGTDALCNGACDGEATSVVAGGTPGYTYQWDNPALSTTANVTGLCAGTFNAVVTDASGCTANASVTINEPAAINLTPSSNDATCGASDGDVSVTATGGAGGFTYLWDDPGASTTATVNGLPAGAYTVTVTDANGCTETVTATINTTTGGTAAAVVDNNVSCFGVCDGEATASMTGGAAPFTYLWSDGQTTATATGLCAGNYNVNVTDNNGCSSSATITITEPTALNAAITAQANPSCAGVCDGTATVSATGGTTTYTYSWTSGGTAANETGICAGNTTVTVTDANGCTVNANLTLTDPPAINITVAGTDATCNAACDGAVDITVTGGTGAYTYAWDNGATSEDISALCAGVYNVTVTDANGCTETATYTVTEPAALTLNTTPTDEVCGQANGEINATATGGTGAITIEWFADAGFTSSLGTTTPLSGLSAGTYYVVATDANGCTINTSVTINNSAAPTVAITIDQNAQCNAACDGAATATVSGGAAPISYLWNNGETTQQALALCAGPIDVTITDANGCIATATDAITEPPAMTLTIVGTDANCNGACDGSADATVSGGSAPYTANWQHGPTSQDLTGVLCVGTYTLDITDAQGCTVSESVTITEPNAIVASIAGTDVSCAGAADGTATVTASGGTGVLVYNWTPAPTAGQGTANATGLTGGTIYTVTVTDDNGCFETLTFTPTEPAVLTVNATSANSNCGQADGSVTANGAGGSGALSYNWFDDAALTNNIGAGTNLGGLAAGTYYVEVTDANGCTASVSVAVVDNSAGTLTHTQLDVTCNGGADGSIDLTVTGGTTPFTYNWTGPGGFTSTTQDPTNLIAGTYDVTVTDNVGCVMALSVTITEPTAVSVTATGVDAVCFGNADGEVSANGTGGTGAVTYEWFDNAALTSSVGTGSPLTGLTAGTYYVEATDANGCTATTSVTITEPAQIIPTLAAVDANCGQADGSISVVSTTGGSGTYVNETWVDGAGNPVANPGAVAGGNYTVTVTDDNGCVGTATIGVNNSVGPTLTIFNQVEASCAGECDGTATVSATGGTAPYTYNWSPAPLTGQGTDAATGLCAGVYTVTVTDANGCVDNVSITITEPVPVVVTITGSTDATINGVADGTADASASGGTPNYTYEWYNGCPPGTTTGQTGQNATGLAAGTYSVIVTDVKGCMDTTCVTINEPNGINTTLTSVDELCNGSCDGSATVTATGGVGAFSYQWYDAATGFPLPGQTGATANNLCAGDYYVIVTDANGGSTTSANVTVGTPTALAGVTAVTSSFNGQDISCNGACDGAVSVTASGGTPGYTYQWDNPALSTTPTVSNLCAGTYNVTITDFNNCTVTVPVTLTEPAALTNTIASNNNSCFGACDGDATANVAGGIAPYTYQWDDPALSTTQTISNLCAGTYNVTITDANGCTFVDQVVITEPTELVLDGTSNGANCGQADGDATVSVVQGDPTYTYQWDAAAGNQTTANATALVAGCYDVTVTDGNGCTATENICVQNLGAPTITPLTVTDVSCFGACDGFAQVQVSGGAPPVNYQWYDAGGAPVSGVLTTPSINNLCAGSYTAEMVDANGCIASTNLTINEPNALNSIVQNTADVTCYGDCDGSITVLASGGTAPYTYAWNDPGAQTTATATGLCPGTYDCIVTDAQGCTFVVTGTVGEPLEIILTASDVDAFCNTPSGSATVNIVQGGVGTINYNWNPTGQTGQTATNLLPNVYTVTVTDADGCTAQTTATVGNIPPGTATSVLVQNAQCNGACDGEATVSMAGGTAPFTYEWYFASNNAPVGQTTQTATGLCAGQYYVVVTDANGCQSTSNNTNIAEPNALAVTLTANDVTCEGNCNGAATVNPTGGTVNVDYDYQWNDALNQITQTALNLCAQTYSVTVTDDNGCSITDSITIGSPVSVVLDSTVVNANCQQADGQGCVIVTGGTAPYTYLWPSGGTNSCEVGLAASTYIVTVTDAQGCSAQIGVEVSDLSGPTAAIIAQTDVSCFGGTDGSATVDMVGGAGTTFTVQWDANAGNQTTPTASNLSAGFYSVTITDDLGCAASTNVTINQPTALQYITSGADPVCFGYCDGSAWVNVSGGTPPYNYSWVNGGGMVVGTTDSVANLCSGTYTVNITDANGCTATDNVTLVDPNQVTASATSTNISCNGACDGTASAQGLVGVGAFTYLWDDPGAQTTATATNLCPGTYTCTVTDADGCFTTVSVTITEPPVLVANIAQSGDVSCSGACDGYAQADQTGGTPGYIYHWSNGGGNNQLAPNLCPNTYTVTVEDANGCQATANVTITEPNPLTLTTTTVNVSCFNACNGSANILLQGGTPPFTYQWDDPAFQTTPNATNLCAGSYTCTITDANGCSITETVLITQPNELDFVANLTNSNCGQSNGAMSVSVIGGIAPFTYQWSDPNGTTSAALNGIPAGCYTITIVDANGCIKDSLLCISDIVGPTVSNVDSTNVTCFGDQDGMVEFNVTGGTGTSVVELLDANNNSLNTGQTLTTNLDGGCYTLQATDAAGCIDFSTICITEPNQINSAVTSSTDVSCFLGCDGQATVSVSGGLPSVLNGYTYSWNAGASTNTATNTGLCAGTYTVTVSDSNNCITTSSIVITEPTQLILTNTNQVDVSCNGACDGTVTVTASGATPPYIYNWTPNVSTGPTASALCAGNYNLNVLDANGCPASNAVTITEPTVLAATGTSTNSTCSQANGTATVNPTGGTAPYTYQWLTGGSNQTSQTNTGMLAGLHTVQVTDANGCTVTINITIIDEPAPTIDGFNLNPPTCNGLSNGSLEVLHSGGTGTITYQWDAAAFNQNSNPAVALGDGTYCVTIQDANGCQATNCATLIEPQPLSPVPDLDATICYGDSSQLWASGQGGTPPYTIIWQTSGLNGQGPITVNPLTSTQYCFDITDANGCPSTGLGCIDITVLPPIATVITPDTSICDGDQIDLTVTASDGNGGPYTFDWVDDQGNPLAGTQNGNSSTITLNPLASGWYYVTTGDGCSLDVLDSVEVIVNPNPSAFLNVVDSSGCSPFTAQFIANSDIGVNYSFDFECDGTVDYVGPNSNPTYTYGTPGTYDVCMTVESADGCTTSLTASQIVTSHPLPIANFGMDPAITTMLNPTITFSDSSSGATVYNWDFGDGYTLSGTPGAVPVGTNDGHTIGTYQNPIHTYTDTGYFDVTLTVENEFGCTDQISYEVYVEGDYILFAPSAFTPNGDGMNDVFYPVGVGLTDNQFEMYIFDRWGQIVFESHSPDYGWDGTDTRSGRTVKLDVYVWLIKTVDHKNIPHEYIGHVTVVR